MFKQYYAALFRQPTRLTVGAVETGETSSRGWLNGHVGYLTTEPTNGDRSGEE